MEPSNPPGPTAVTTNAVVASCVELFPGSGVGAVGVPENTGLTLLFCTNAVVASWVELSALAAVGAVGTPENPGLTLLFCTNAVVAN